MGIRGTVYLPLAVPQQLEERFDEILQKAEAINDPFEQSFFAMVQLPYLPKSNISSNTFKYPSNATRPASVNP